MADDIQQYPPKKLTAASQVEMEANSLTTVYTSPGAEKYHPGTAKAWAVFCGTRTLNIEGNYNVSGVTDMKTGLYQFGFTTAFSSTFYVVATSAHDGGARPLIMGVHSKSASTIQLEVENYAGSAADCKYGNFIVFGDFA